MLLLQAGGICTTAGCASEWVGVSCQTRLLQALTPVSVHVNGSANACSVAVSFPSFSTGGANTYYVGEGPIAFYSIEYMSSNQYMSSGQLSLVTLVHLFYNTSNSINTTIHTASFNRDLIEKTFSPFDSYTFYLVPYADFSHIYNLQAGQITQRGIASPSSSIVRFPVYCFTKANSSSCMHQSIGIFNSIKIASTSIE